MSFRALQDLLAALPSDLAAQSKQELEFLTEKGLPPAVSTRIVAVLFGLSPRFVGALQKKARNYYRVFDIPKGRSSRRIEAPKVGLKIIQKWVSFHLAKAVRLPDCVHGFVTGRSFVSAASAHCGAEWVMSLDIRDFFPSVSSQRLFEPLQEVGYQRHSIETLLRLCTLQDHLPQGAPSSPVLSNLAFLRTDSELVQLAASQGCVYTRYADDLVFSGKGDLPPNLLRSIRSVLKSHFWRVSENKLVVTKVSHLAHVHGLNVGGCSPRLPKAYRRWLRLARHLLIKGRVSEHQAAVYRGHLAFAASVQGGACRPG